MFSLRQRIKSALRRFGYDITRITVQTSPEVQLRRILDNFGIDLVLDVGANEGQFAHRLRRNGYAGRIVSFEPLSQAHARLVEASRWDPLWKAADRTAIGESEGQIDIHVAANSASSSILGMLPAHSRAAPYADYVGRETVPLARLDRACEPFLGGSRSIFVKIDTQGYEARVLAGGAQTLARTTALQVELSLVPLYEGQTLFGEMVARIEALGFELFALTPEFVDPGTGRTLQVNGIFCRA
jgi:FkbM family methyltransferase